MFLLSVYSARILLCVRTSYYFWVVHRSSYLFKKWLLITHDNKRHWKITWLPALIFQRLWIAINGQGNCLRKFVIMLQLTKIKFAFYFKKNFFVGKRNFKLKKAGHLPSIYEIKRDNWWGKWIIEYFANV